MTKIKIKEKNNNSKNQSGSKRNLKVRNNKLNKLKAINPQVNNKINNKNKWHSRNNNNNNNHKSLKKQNNNSKNNSHNSNNNRKFLSNIKGFSILYYRKVNIMKINKLMLMRFSYKKKLAKLNLKEQEISRNMDIQLRNY